MLRTERLLVNKKRHLGHLGSRNPRNRARRLVSFRVGFGVLRRLLCQVGCCGLRPRAPAARWRADRARRRSQSHASHSDAQLGRFTNWRWYSGATKRARPIPKG